MLGTARERAQPSVIVVAGLGLLYAVLAWAVQSSRASATPTVWPASPMAHVPLRAEAPPVEGDVVWSAAGDIDSAEVRLRSAPDGMCRHDPTQHRHVCSTKAWLWVGRHGAMVTGAPTAGLWIHPAPGAERTTIRWPDVALGQRLRGRLGLERGAGGGGTVVVSAEVDDVALGTWEVREELVAASFDVELPPGAPRGTLTLTVFAHQDGRRLAVLDAVMVGSRVAAEAEVVQ